MKKIIASTISLILGFSINSYAEGNMKIEKATFAGGCFWCIQPAFDNLEGVTKTTVGYSGGDAADSGGGGSCSVHGGASRSGADA